MWIGTERASAALEEKAADYADGWQKASLDRLFASGLILPVIAGQLVVKWGLLGQHEEAVIKQERVGLDNETFEMLKFHTQNTETKEPLFPHADFMRAKGWDEAVQREHMKGGRKRKMSMRAHRGLLVVEHNLIVDPQHYPNSDMYQVVVDNERPGALNSYGLYTRSHPVAAHNETDIRVILDYRDFISGSVKYDLGIAIQYVALLLGGHAKNGNSGPTRGLVVED